MRPSPMPDLAELAVAASPTSPPSPESSCVATLARPLSTVRDDMTLEAFALLLLDHRLSTVAVVTETGRVVGFASMSDLLRQRERERKTPRGHPDHGEERVRDIMMPFVLTLRDRASIPWTAAVMAAREVHRLVLISDAGKPTGMVHALDVLGWFVRRGAIRERA